MASSPPEAEEGGLKRFFEQGGCFEVEGARGRCSKNGGG